MQVSQEICKFIDSLIADMEKRWCLFTPEKLRERQAENRTLEKVRGAIEKMFPDDFKKE